MNDKWDKWTKKFSLISTIVAIIGGGGILGWCTMHSNKVTPIMYKGSVQESVSRNIIAGARITILGLSDKIPPRETDSNGCFAISLSQEYPNVKVMITHKDYETQEFYRELIKKHLHEPDNFYLTPRIKDEPKAISPTPIIETITETGSASNYYKDKAIESAKANAVNNLKNNHELTDEQIINREFTILKIDSLANNIKATVEVSRKSYVLKVTSEKPTDFEIVIPEDGNLTLTLESFAENTYFALYNKNGTSFNPINQSIISGQRTYPRIPNGFNNNDKFVGCSWNTTIEKFVGSFTFILEADTYYFRIIRSQTGLNNVNLSVQHKAM